MRKLFVLSTGLLSFLFSFAQKEKSENTVSQTAFYAELGGPGILFSANVDRRFTKSNLGWGGRIGVGFVSGDLQVDTGYYTSYKLTSVVTIPLQVNYIFGKSNSPHTFEVGAGITILGKKLGVLDYYDEDRSSLFFTASFMYRRQPPNGGFSWRAGFTPLIAKGYIQPFGAVSLGYNF